MVHMVQTTGASQCNCHMKSIIMPIALVAAGAAFGYLASLCWMRKRGRINYTIHPMSNKVVDAVDVEDIGEKKSFCRCWKSEKFPYCDGAHKKHNSLTGDNVGPLIVKKKE